MFTKVMYLYIFRSQYKNTHSCLEIIGAEIINGE